MSIELLINSRPSQTRVAYVENGRLMDLKIDRTIAPTLVGSVYKGKVLRVLPGMQAAFVDIGLSRAAFLYVGDIRVDVSPDTEHFLEDPVENDDVGDERSSTGELPPVETLSGEAFIEKSLAMRTPIQDLLKEGQMLLVQVAKDPLGTKGARITTHISLPGRHVVYMPTVKHYGVSRRIDDESERDRLLKLLQQLNPVGGVIIRTAGEGASSTEIQNDIQYLDRLWSEVQSSYEKKKGVGLLHAEIDVELRALRDLLSDKVDRVLVDDPKTFKKVQSFISHFLPSFKNKISLFKGDRPLFEMYDIELELQRALSRKIWLKSGGYIVIDEAEALVVIDVNTGRFVGKRDFEETILTTNIEAAREIAHQLRIRNCGGIIIIDFIDMERLAHREKVVAVLNEELQKDRAKTMVSAISDLGLVEMTRKRIRPSLLSSLCDPCPYCEGKGYVKQKVTIAHEIFRNLEKEFQRRPDVAGVVVHCHAEVVDWIYDEESEALELLEQKLSRPIHFKAESSFHLEQYSTQFN